MSASQAGTAGTGATRGHGGHLLTVLGLAGLLALFAWNVRHTWFLSDDAFITFRYARNLAEGLGPVWNAGERVEGYTNFLWMLLLAAGMRLGLRPEVLANVLGVASGAALLVAYLRCAARGRSLASPWPWLGATLLAASRSFAAWSTGGLETMLFALLVFLGFARLIAPVGARDPLVSGLAFTAAALTRPEGVLFGALAFLVLLADVAVRRRPARALLAFAVPCVAIVGAHLLWRHAYYGDWVPNTFRAKVPGAWLEQGARWFAYLQDSYRLGWFLPLGAAALLGAERRAAVAVLAVLAVYAGYVLTVGGDVFELRFWVHVLPLSTWLLVEGLAALAGLARAAGAGRALALRSAAALAAAALLLATATGFERVPARRYGILAVSEMDAYTRRRCDEGLFLRAEIERGVLPGDLVLGLGGAGAVPYYTRWTCVDRRGLNDATIARIPVDERGFIGHERDAPWAYLVQRRVAAFDVLNQIVVKRARLAQLREPFFHDGRRLRMRAVPLGDHAFVFATFVGDEELARLLPGLEILKLPLE